jgi:predicted membrane protein
MKAIRMSPQDMHGVRAALIIILLWVAVWNLTEEAIEYIEERYGIKRWKMYVSLLVVIFVLIAIDPYVFEDLVA